MLRSYTPYINIFNSSYKKVWDKIIITDFSKSNEVVVMHLLAALLLLSKSTFGFLIS